MAKEATKTTTAAKAPKDEPKIKVLITSDKPIKIGSMNVGKGHRDSLPKSIAEELIKDGVASKIY